MDFLIHFFCFVGLTLFSFASFAFVFQRVDSDLAWVIPFLGSLFFIAFSYGGDFLFATYLDWVGGLAGFLFGMFALRGISLLSILSSLKIVSRSLVKQFSEERN